MLRSLIDVFATSTGANIRLENLKKKAKEKGEYVIEGDDAGLDKKLGKDED